MSRIRTNEDRGGGRLPWNEGAAACRNIRTQIAGAKEAIFAESGRAFPVPERLVRLALNEAEAMAWQTSYPHLVFPGLATEKVRTLADWNARQQSVRGTGPTVVFAM
jgi:hypothetical protein